MGRMGEVTDPTSPAVLQSDERPIRPCPVCGSVLHDVLYEQRFEAFAAGSITDAYDVVACRTCGMCFASGLPEEARFSEYYGLSSKYDLSAAGAEATSFDVQRHKEVAEFIAAHVADRSGPVLDVGTATGALLLALREEGFTSVHGVEPSADAARKARVAYGLDVIAGDSRTAKAWPDGFSVVSLVAVLEHLIDPLSALRETVELLKSAGFLYLLVPDAARFSNYVDAPYQQFSVEHVNYFTLNSLRNLLASVGFEVVVERANIVRPTYDAQGPGIEVLCRRTSRQPEVRIDFDGVAELRRYIARSAEKEAGILDRIAELAKDQRPIYVWGTGTNALHLLASSRLAECNIIAFLDSNPHYAGQPLAGRIVMAPGDVEKLEAPILVASAVSQTAIATAARNLFGPDVPLILMY
jgi:SAM-dependent methyltransferase